MFRALWILFAFLLVLSSCSTTNLGISSSADSMAAEKSNDLSTIRTFEVVVDEIPAFLGPIIVSNFSVAMAERGLHPVMHSADAIVMLRFQQDDFGSVKQRDDFDERIDQGGETRFVARIVVEVRSSASEKILWSGSIQRLHTIRPGDYMHTGRASIALLSAFRELLADYPVGSNDYDSEF